MAPANRRYDSRIIGPCVNRRTPSRATGSMGSRVQPSFTDPLRAVRAPAADELLVHWDDRWLT